MDIFDKRCDIKIQQIKPKAEHLKTFPNLVLHDENAFLVIFRVAMFTRVILQAIPFILVRKAFTFWLEKLLPFAIIRFPFFPTMYFQGIFGKKDIDFVPIVMHHHSSPNLEGIQHLMILWTVIIAYTDTKT